ncbi:unnamed protein product [Linum tenue]|uniref:Reverse transcriptase Ty1/copia-type domain-containing protein n=1 Tax=Linum tenue TaxID=586396 RepID=A0AAV0HGS8_9ROSI|nr:unnamed protein product [Linum tenue]CAI0383708.1 unnamed protein product [Linum tenue]
MCALCIALKGWSLIQLDVKNAFLHEDMKEAIYIELTPSYTKGHSGMVCKLVRSLYGLKQTPRTWFEKFHGTMFMRGLFRVIMTPPCSFDNNGWNYGYAHIHR